MPGNILKADSLGTRYYLISYIRFSNVTGNNKIIAWWNHKEGEIKSDIGIDQNGQWERQLKMREMEMVWVTVWCLNGYLSVNVKCYGSSIH